MSITGFLLVRDSGGVEAGASGGHQEVQGAAAADPAGSPAPDVPPHDVIDRSRSPRSACWVKFVRFDFGAATRPASYSTTLFKFVVPSYCISLIDDWKIIRLFPRVLDNCVGFLRQLYALYCISFLLVKKCNFIHARAKCNFVLHN
jgi:hypothetical protein